VRELHGEIEFTKAARAAEYDQTVELRTGRAGSEDELEVELRLA